MFLDTSMADSSRKRLMTLIADGVLSEGTKQKGIQMVIGADFDVEEFGEDIRSGVLKVKSDVVALMIGNDQLKAGRPVNISKKVEKLIRQLWIVRPKAEVFVSSILPKPTQETVTEALVMKANLEMSVMCRRLAKYGKNMVRYMPLHQLFLEKWRHVDEKTGRRRVTTRVVQPHGRFYLHGTDKLNKDGVQKVLVEIQQIIKKDRDGAMVSLMGRPGLVIQIDNDFNSNKTSQHANSYAKSQKGDKGGLRPTQRWQKRSTTGDKIDTEAPGTAKNGELVKKHKTISVPSKKKVSQMVDKWEQLSQGAPVENLDVELGEDSIVLVDLGDQPYMVESGTECPGDE